MSLAIRKAPSTLQADKFPNIDEFTVDRAGHDACVPSLSKGNGVYRRSRARRPAGAETARGHSVRIRVPTVIDCLIGVALSLMLAERCLAQPRVPRIEVVGGFGKLSWGVSVEQAQAIYRDLFFGSYVV